jgi:hypothetical protein
MNGYFFPLVLSYLFFSSPAWALSAAELNVYGPSVEYHELELETRSFLSGQGANHEQGHSFAVGYAPTSYWATEAYQVLHKDPGMALVAETIEWENIFQLASPGRYWADPGVLIETEFPQQKATPGEVRLSPLLEKQFGDELLTLDLPLEWQFGPQFTPGTDFSYAARAEHLWNAYFSPAVEAFGEPGVIGRWQRADTQNHSVGPSFYGSVRCGGKRKLKYSAAALFGLTHASADWTMVTRLELEL